MTKRGLEQLVWPRAAGIRGQNPRRHSRNRRIAPLERELEALRVLAPTAVPANSNATTTARSTARRFDELDAYRGLAALTIVVFHAGYFAGYHPGLGGAFFTGTALEFAIQQFNSGVIWFFVLSGFLIFYPFARAAIEQSRPIAPGHFLLRRAIRILPLYYLVFVLIWLMVRGGLQEPWRDLFLHLTFTHVFDRAHFLWTIGPAWSLADEVIFYLCIAALGPFLYRLCRSLVSRRVRAILVAGCVAGLGGMSFAYTLWAHHVARISDDNLTVYSGPVAMFHVFALGMGLAIIAAYSEGRFSLGAWGALLVRLGGVALSCFAIVARLGLAPGGGYFSELFGLAFALVLASTVLTEHKSLWQRVLANPVCQFFGLISYSVYLWHEAIIWILFQAGLLGGGTMGDFVRSNLLVFAVVIAVASASYWAIERPTRRWRTHFGEGASRPTPAPTP